MKISNSEHLNHPWRVHSLLPDMKVEDVWLLPVKLDDKQTIGEVQAVFAQAIKETSNRGVAGLLFKFRFFLGKVFGWDEKVNSTSTLPVGSIRARYAGQESLGPADFSSKGFDSFIPVYSLEMESLAEIENKTVLAALHLGKVALGQHQFGIQMTVYVKPKGLFGETYMQLIKPFRLYIVYPFLLKLIGKQWEKYNLTQVE